MFFKRQPTAIKKKLSKSLKCYPEEFVFLNPLLCCFKSNGYVSFQFGILKTLENKWVVTSVA